METEAGVTREHGEVRCAECQSLLTEGQDREVTEDGVFCRPCFNTLMAQVKRAVQAQSAGINYPMALVGGVLGGAVGVVAWWAFTVLTKISFGLVAVVIGLGVGKGVTLLAGDKRSQELQIMSVILATVSFFYASYLVNRTFVQRALAEEGQVLVLPLLPNPELFFNVVSLNFGLFDLVFLAIVLYEAWKLPAPIRLGQ